jgi:hypothetical protein
MSPRGQKSDDRRHLRAQEPRLRGGGDALADLAREDNAQQEARGRRGRGFEARLFRTRLLPCVGATTLVRHLTPPVLPLIGDAVATLVALEPDAAKGEGRSPGWTARLSARRSTKPWGAPASTRAPTPPPGSAFTP